LNIITITHKSINCYLVPLQEGWLMVDTGMPDTFSQLLHQLSQNNISVNEINYLVVTHFHPDHAGLVQALKDLGTNLILHEYQVPYINKLNLFFKKNPKANYRDITFSNHVVVTEEESKEFLKSIGIDGILLSTPGHSDDSISLVINDCCAFVGDLPAPHPAEAFDDIVIEDSWNMIRQQHIKTVYPGHSEPYELQAEG
jgi:glyoxylase-like metal-dependent hydrolase (beta-lactamase superfamily II)